MNLSDSHKEIRSLLDAHEEWLLIEPAGASFSLRREEIELAFEREKLLLSFLDSKGFQTWRITDWKFTNQKLLFNLARNFDRERMKIELVTRLSPAELMRSLELARIEKANQIARLIVENEARAKLISVRLNQETGRFAQIVYEKFPGGHIAALADVSAEATSERILSFSILWLEKLSNRKKNPIEKIRILATGKSAKDLARLRALLKESWQSKIEVYEIASEKDKPRITNCDLNFQDLWREKPRKFSTIKRGESGDTARKIIDLSPDEIDRIFTRHGETLRFRGLPFARVRKIFGEEKAWFGIEAKRRILNEKTLEEFSAMLADLKTYRRFDGENKRHEFYRLAPEAWLESILRKNVKCLDANLILSPVYNQFRISGDRIDLLALRRDARLVIIELKTSADRDSVFQAADYWRQVEQQRRAGNLQKAKIFGDLEISDQPTLVYLVAPTLSFHRDFELLASSISSEIEIARFNLNENWRENLRVMKREKLTG